MTYEYACEACGHQWEAEQSIKDAPLKTCASCGKNKAKRLVSGGTGFLLKGGGWYADGYGSKAASSSSSSEGTAAKGSAEPASKSDGAGESKASTESKPAASTETKASSSEPAAKAAPVAPPPSKKAS